MGKDSGLQLFTFQEREVRFVGTSEIPEWVASDVVSILYPDSRRENLSNYLSKVPAEWKGNKQIITPGGKQTATTLFEPGLYCLIVRSDSPLAVPFQKWVYEEVLPSIRKTGSYSITPQQSTPLTLPARGQLENIRLGMDLLYELGGIDERTQLALRDIVRDILLESKLKKPEGQNGRLMIPVSDRARTLGYRPDREQLKKIGRFAAQFYRLRHDGEDPPKREQYVDGTTRMVKCYDEDDIDILDQASALVMNPPAELPPASDSTGDIDDPPF